jgi:hypothetical protein
MTPSGASSDTTDAPGAWLHVTDIGPVEPLDAQFGVHPKKTVPAALQDALFGQPAPSAAERAAFGEAPLATYAVLDAAKMPYLLTGLLDTSGLRYQSLFQGAAEEELAEHAPYLVELKEDHDFTGRLFTGPDGPGGLWDRDLGIFLRTRAGFEPLRRHLRKFTRVQDETGKWFYFRFWDYPVSTTILSLGNRSELTGFVSPFFAHDPSRRFVLQSGFGSWLTLQAQTGMAEFRTKPIMMADVRRFMGRVRQVLEFETLAQVAIRHVARHKHVDPPAAMTALRAWRDRFLQTGFWRRDHLVSLCVWELSLGPDFLNTYGGGRVAHLLQQNLAPHEVIGAITRILEDHAIPKSEHDA